MFEKTLSYFDLILIIIMIEVNKFFIEFIKFIIFNWKERLMKMKGMRQMVIDAFNDGEIHIETNGFTGESCKTETQFLKDAIGETIAETLKPIFYVKERQLTGEEKIKEGRMYKPICG